MRSRSGAFRGAIAVLATLSLSMPTATSAAPTVTIVEGDSTIVSGKLGLLPARGVQLRSCDIVSTGPQALIQLEVDDGGMIMLGPDTRFVSEPPSSGAPAVGPYLLLSGWAKVTVPARDKAPPYHLGTPQFDVLIDAGVVVVRATAEGGQFFVEQGAAVALESSGPKVNVGSERTYSRKSGRDKSELRNGADPAFVKALPRSLRDTLPALLAQLNARDVRPEPAPDFKPSVVDEWIKTHPELRRCYLDSVVQRAQELLDRSGFKLGPIDGILGPRTQAALREFQQQEGLPRTGQLDPDTLKALDAAVRR